MAFLKLYTQGKSSVKVFEKGLSSLNCCLETMPMMERKTRINIFKVKGLYVLKHYFEAEVFKELLKYYSKKNFRFEFGSVGARNKVIRFLDKLGFDVYFLDDYSSYVVKVDKQLKYASILKDAVAFKEVDRNRIFLMKDEAAVEQAILHGAERFKDKIEF